MRATTQNQWYPSVNPKEAWKESWGWLVRLRSIFGATVLDVLLSSLSWYFGFGWKVAIGILLAGMIFVGALFVLRRVRIYTVCVGGAFHRLCDGIREDMGSILSAAVSPDPGWYLVYRERYNRFHDDVAERTALFFRALVGDSSINCAIRLARPGNDGEEEYPTSGRSKDMCPSRAEKTKPVPGNKGIACFLRNKLHRGVYIVKDIDEAVQQGAWDPSPNDDLPDVNTLMVAPINGYGYRETDYETKSMLGILFITSRSDVFRQIHVEPLMAVADLLGSVYPIVTGREEPSHRSVT